MVPIFFIENITRCFFGRLLHPLVQKDKMGCDSIGSEVCSYIYISYICISPN